MRLWRRSFLRTKSGYRDQLHDEVHLRRRCHPAKVTYDENEDIVIGYSMSTYDFGEYLPQ